ncbi:MAG: histidine--tRNA ligase [Candidatus Altiarchaeales archaeon ex4484_96]|nr:MAG: histidine--tRNA ligase [Candidatus Altiarchaeales archaeon ex4484_96]
MIVDRPRGTRDFPPQVVHERNHAKKRLESLFRRYNYREVVFPTLEHSALFKVKSGEEIGEHMYVFKDKGGREVCLRPEATASVARMFVDSLREKKKPVKVYYYGPMYRYERPQRGRYREFWQMGVELMGADCCGADSEVIALACESMKCLGLDYSLDVGHIGVLRGYMNALGLTDSTQDDIIFYLDTGKEDRVVKAGGDEVISELVTFKGEASVLDKAEKLLKGHDKALESLRELSAICELLDGFKLDYNVDLGLGRGLEYYTGMVFEMRVSGLGAENQVCGGGRYDKLIELFGGPPTPAVGFAFGFDRLMEALREADVSFPQRNVDVLVAPVNEKIWPAAFKLASMLREEYIVEIDLLGRKLGKTLEWGADINSKYALIVGPADYANNEVTLRDMSSGEQVKVEINKLKDELVNRLG